MGILAANYGQSGKSWEQGDFNADGRVDVGDLGILAANYGTGTIASMYYTVDYAKVFGTAVNDNPEEEDTSSMCNGLGLELIAGLALMGLMMVKSDARFQEKKC